MGYRRDDDPRRLNEDNAEYTGCKLGTQSTCVWIFEEDFPLSKGDVIRYTERENGNTKRGRVISDPEERYLFIGLDENSKILDE